MNRRNFTLRWHFTTAAVLTLALTATILPAREAGARDRPDNWNVDGAHGVLHVRGTLLEGACRLDMTSAFQLVSLGSTARGVLRHPGDRGQPVAFRLRLRDCSRSGGAEENRYTGTITQDAIQPVVTFSFTGVTDPDMPRLLKVSGVSGVGLQLTDPLGRHVRPGERGEPVMLMPGDNDLIYQVTPVRTPAPLIAGDYRAVANFEVSYD